MNRDHIAVAHVRKYCTGRNNVLNTAALELGNHQSIALGYISMSSSWDSLETAIRFRCAPRAGLQRLNVGADHGLGRREFL